VENSPQEEAGPHPAFVRHGFPSYLGVPLRRPDGSLFGTLCALDTEPGRGDLEEHVQLVQLLADLLSHHLLTEEAMTAQQRALAAERRTAELRERFLAVLGHDLKNPLNAILVNSELLLDGKAADLEEVEEISGRLHGSASRIAEMVDELLDFARGRLGRGIQVRPEPLPSVRDLVEEVVAEVADATPGCTIEVRGEGAMDEEPMEVEWDRNRVAQALTNLLTNAVRHGHPEQPIRVELESSDGEVEMRVTNQGRAIERDLLPSIFEPFHRRDDSDGLGLGLYITRQIIDAHGGTIAVRSDDEITVFSLRLPRRAEAPSPR